MADGAALAVALGLREAGAGRGRRRWRRSRGQAKQRRRWRTRAAVQSGSGARRIKDAGGAPGGWRRWGIGCGGSSPGPRCVCVCVADRKQGSRALTALRGSARERLRGGRDGDLGNARVKGARAGP